MCVYIYIYIYIYIYAPKKTNPPKLCESKVVSVHTELEHTPKRNLYQPGYKCRDPGFIVGVAGGGTPTFNLMAVNFNCLSASRPLLWWLHPVNGRKALNVVESLGNPRVVCFFFPKSGGLEVERIRIIYKIKHIYIYCTYMYIFCTYILYIVYYILYIIYYIIYICKIYIHNLDLPTPPGGVLECGEDLLCTLKTCCYSLGELKSWVCI